MSNYVDNLNAMKAQQYHLASKIKDQWRTPEWLFQAINHLYGPVVLDLFTDGQNAKCPRYYTAEDNALSQNWSRRLMEIREDIAYSGYDDQVFAFANPPYSREMAGDDPLTGMTHIMEKADMERKRGGGTIWLTKSATSEGWWPDATATQIIFIKGRIGFEPPAWFNPHPDSSKPTSAGFGAAIILFDPENDKILPNAYITREELLEIGAPLAKLSQDERDAWIKTWDEV